MYVLDLWFIKSKVPYLILEPIMLSIREQKTNMPITQTKNIIISRKDFLEMIEMIKKGTLFIELEQPCKEHNGLIRYIVNDIKEVADRQFAIVGLKDRVSMSILKKTKIMDYKTYERD